MPLRNETQILLRVYHIIILKVNKHYHKLKLDSALEAAEQSVNDTLELNINHQLAHVLLADIYCGFGRAHFERDELDAARKSANMALQLDEKYASACTLLDDIKKAHVKKGRDAFNRE